MDTLYNMYATIRLEVRGGDRGERIASGYEGGILESTAYNMYILNYTAQKELIGEGGKFARKLRMMQ